MPRESDEGKLTVAVGVARQWLAANLPGGILNVAGLWHYAARNRRIARLATALRAGDEQQVRQLLPELPSPSPVPADPRLLVLVENVEHALALARQLPGWTLLTGQDVCSSGLGKKDRQLLQAGKKTWPTLRAVLVTATALQHADLGGFDVVLRADGGTRPAPLPACPSLPSGRPVRPLLLVDLDDRPVLAGPLGAFLRPLPVNAVTACIRVAASPVPR